MKVALVAILTVGKVKVVGLTSRSERRVYHIQKLTGELRYGVWVGFGGNFRRWISCLEAERFGDARDEAYGDRKVLCRSIHDAVLPRYYRVRSNVSEKSFIISLAGRKYAILVLWE